MAIHITQIGKQKFVCGLFWQSLSRPRELKKEAKDLAKRINSDLMVLLRNHATAQAGFAHTKEGARRMTYSLAAAVSSRLREEGGYYDGRIQPVHDWLGAFKLPDGLWAYFAVRDANFLPNGDFAGTKEEVLDRLHGDYGLGGWNMVIGDAELEEHGFHNFSPRRIEELVPRNKNGQVKVQRWWALHSVDTAISGRMIAVSAVCAALLVIAGAVAWQMYQKKREAEDRERSIEAARKKMFGGAAAAPARPWPGKPAPLAMTRACVDNFAHIRAGGWQLDTYECADGQARFAWLRGESTVDFLLAQVPQATVDLTGEKASHQVPLNLGPGKDEALLTEKELIEPLLSRLQLLKLAPKVAKAGTPAPPATSIPGLANANAAPPEWQTYSITLTTGGLSPLDVASLLDRPGVRLEKIAYKGGKWSIEGVMYAK